MLIASCGGDVTEKESKEEKEKKELIEKEKDFIAKLKNNVNLLPDQWVDLEKDLRNLKDNASTQDLEVLIYMMECNIDPSKRTEDPDLTVVNKEYINSLLITLDSVGNSIQDKNQSKRILTDVLEIVKNFKQQAELKSKKYVPS
jgi:hypothetical protein